MTYRFARVALLLLTALCAVASAEGRPEPGLLRVDAGHPWRPPFGIERVGQRTCVAVSPPAGLLPDDETWIVGYSGEAESARERVTFSGSDPVTVNLPPAIERAVLLVGRHGAFHEAASLTIHRAGFEADAEAVPEKQENPVDLGLIFPPDDWLVLSKGTGARLNVAAFSRTQPCKCRVVAWFERSPSDRVEMAMPLNAGQRATATMPLPEADFSAPQDTLHVNIEAEDGTSLWQKTIHAMLITERPTWPGFGAAEAHLRYDMPISLLDRDAGMLSEMPYEQGWPPGLKDVVVSLPNGSRFVFWRGSSYVPFWAGPDNTGLSYEWAETGPLPEGFVDSVEPLMDKELRYSRVEIVKSTAAVVHVRWTYQSCDFEYKVWGDAAQENFVFYPDGFGTRVLTLNSAPDANYELSEFIVLAPAEAYPFDILPEYPVRCLGMDGTATELTIPFLAGAQPKGPEPPVLYRVRFGANAATAVYFNPRDPFHAGELVTFRPFYDQGYLVTPAYWGSHWPLGRGKTTGGEIDERLHVSPSHNSLVSWERRRPEPVWTRTGPSIDTLGRTREMKTQCWVWLIGMSDESDGDLLARAGSFSKPAALSATGARLDVPSYLPERRAYQLTCDAPAVELSIAPEVRCVNPVFDIAEAPAQLRQVSLDGTPLDADAYAWDGETLWLGITVEKPARLRLEFD